MVVRWCTTLSSPPASAQRPGIQPASIQVSAPQARPALSQTPAIGYPTATWPDRERQALCRRVLRHVGGLLNDVKGLEVHPHGVGGFVDAAVGEGVGGEEVAGLVVDRRVRHAAIATSRRGHGEGQRRRRGTRTRAAVAASQRTSRPSAARSSPARRGEREERWRGPIALGPDPAPARIASMAAAKTTPGAPAPPDVVRRALHRLKRRARRAWRHRRRHPDDTQSQGSLRRGIAHPGTMARGVGFRWTGDGLGFWTRRSESMQSRR